MQKFTKAAVNEAIRQGKGYPGCGLGADDLTPYRARGDTDPMPLPLIEHLPPFVLATDSYDPRDPGQLRQRNEQYRQLAMAAFGDPRVQNEARIEYIVGHEYQHFMDRGMLGSGCGKACDYLPSRLFRHAVF